MWSRTRRLDAFESPSVNFGEELQGMEARFIGRSTCVGVEPQWGLCPTVGRFVAVTVLLTCHSFPDRNVGLSIVMRCI